MDLRVRVQPCGLSAEESGLRQTTLKVVSAWHVPTLGQMPPMAVGPDEFRQAAVDVAEQELVEVLGADRVSAVDVVTRQGNAAEVLLGWSPARRRCSWWDRAAMEVSRGCCSDLSAINAPHTPRARWSSSATTERNDHTSRRRWPSARIAASRLAAEASTAKSVGPGQGPWSSGRGLGRLRVPRFAAETAGCGDECPTGSGDTQLPSESSGCPNAVGDGEQARPAPRSPVRRGLAVV